MVAGYRTLTFDDETRRYLILDLRDTSNSTVLIPYDRIEDLDLRPVTVTMDMVRKIMYQSPYELDDHYRTRQSNVEERVKEGTPGALVRTLRDLCWREHTEKLTKVDKDIQNRIYKRLIKELALSTSQAKAIVRQRLKELIFNAMENHEGKVEVASV